jgi:Mrp family chromosome partitioning ATPase/capsular polysaccharide biosynthesis protein
MATEQNEGLSARSYLGVGLRWKWLILAVTVVIALAGAAYAWTRTPMYSATAQLLYVQQIGISSSLGQGQVDQTLQQADIGSVPAVVSSAVVGAQAGRLLNGVNTSAGYSTSVSLATDTSTSGYSSVVGIAATSSDPRTAAAAANAYATAFIAWRRDSERARVNQEILAVQSQLQTYTTPTQRASADYLTLQQNLQNLQLSQKSVTGDFSVISPASVPSTPFSPRKTRTLLIAIVVGLVLGCGLAFLLEQLDTRVRDEAQVTGLLGLSVLGHLPPLARKAGEPGVIQMLINPFGLMAEAVRVLRGNLDFMGVDHDVRSLLVSSSVQGEGKSTTACNLAVSMALAGKRVVLVDADLRRPRIHDYMGIASGPGLSSVIARRAKLADALVSIRLDRVVGPGDDVRRASNVRARDAEVRVFSASVPEAGPEPAVSLGSRDVVMSLEAGWSTNADDDPVLRVLPSGPLPPNPGEMVASRRFAEIIAELSADADLVLIDTPAMLSVGDTAPIAAKADALVFVVNTSLVSRPLLERAHAQLAKLSCRKLGLVLISNKGAHGPYYGYHYHRTAAPKPGRGSSGPA